MKLLPSDPDIQTIVSRIRSGDLNLQPDFQRGEVWSDSKKRRLIDSVLRDWHIPPIHVIELRDTRKQEVLDGQQRLVAIRDFVDGKIKVDGKIEPLDSEISNADGCTYESLSEKLRRQFDQFTIRIFRLVDYKPEEPGELFFRLNQPTSLTAAEQRNAFFGPVRGQIRQLADRFPSFGLHEFFLGFSNSRMAYDDTIAKVCVCLERRTLREKLTASAITERYRSEQPFDSAIIQTVESALQTFGRAGTEGLMPMKFNKATLFSWLVFTIRLLKQPRATELTRDFADFLTGFESTRTSVRRSEPDAAGQSKSGTRQFIELFNDRASARVSDVISVLTRDVVLSWFFVRHLKTNQRSELLNGSIFARLDKYSELFAEIEELDAAGYIIDKIITNEAWGNFP